jgi:NADPH-dependent stearoyl-CoA 9-desaturase
MIGSANIKGTKAMHIMTGNLSHQIEHHLFPDLPSNRYAEIAPKVQEICSRYGLAYTSGSLPRQVASAWKQVIKLSLPNGFSIRNAANRVLRRRPPTKSVQRHRGEGNLAVTR